MSDDDKRSRKQQRSRMTVEAEEELAPMDSINESLLNMIRKMQQLRGVNTQEAFVSVVQHALCEYFRNCDTYTLDDEKILWDHYLKEVVDYHKKNPS